jgi:toxin-antitoxin system PIN domain toxin
VIAFDTNLLVYAHRADSPFHSRASRLVKEAAEGAEPWALLWPCLHEFLAVVTHPRIFRQPTEPGAALAQVEAWLSSPVVAVLGEGDGYWEALAGVVRPGRVQGPKVHDARIAALVRFHGVDQLWSADRDFSRFPGLPVRNPLVAAP